MRPPATSGEPPTAPRLGLIGREADLEAVGALLCEPGVRLLTITGVGGVGKTRLARAVAEDRAGAFPDGTVLVPLSALLDPAHVTSAVGRALGIGEQGDRPLLDALCGELGGLEMLLALDNFEHLLGAAPLVAEILARCPTVSVLVTSRSPLRLTGEFEYPLEPLALPARDRLPPPEELALVPSVRLFVERARMVSPAFRLTAENAPDIAAICARLDGVPLALQLAAAGLKLLSPAQLLERLASPLDVLVGGRRDMPERQQTMRSTLEWSHGLLAPGERRLFARLAVFAGGCTPGAAEAIGALGRPAEPAVLADLMALVDYSLLRRREGPGGDARLAMLQTVRAYALERLREGGEEAAVRAAHADLFLALAEEAAPILRFDADPSALDRVEAEHDNLRAALRWFLERRDAERALRLAAGLARFWLVRGHLSEGRGWLDEALAQGASAASPAVTTRALWGAGILAHYQNDYDVAVRRFRESLALARAVGDREAEARALAGLATTVGRHRDPDAARAMYSEALGIARELGDDAMAVSLTAGLGAVLWYRGDVGAARPLLLESLEGAEALGLAYEAAAARQILGWIALSEDDPAEARVLLEACAMVFGDLRDRWGVARCRLGIGYAALAAGDLASARVSLADCLRIVGDLGHRLITCACIGGLAIAAAADGRPERAATLLGAATALREALGASHSAAVREAQEHAAAVAREALGGPAFRRAADAGAALSLERATALAEREAGEGEAEARVAGLTLAEMRVLRLVARGLTNADVARELVVSERTVHAHLRAVYRKLGVSNRAGATRIAVERGLVGA